MGFALNLAESRPDPSPLPIHRTENTIDKIRFACNFRGGQNRAPLFV